MIRGLARILILHAVVSFRVRGQIVSQKPPESANFRKKKFPPRIPPIFVIPKTMPVSMPVDRIDAGRILCRSGVEPPTGTIHPRQIPPTTPNPESHPPPQCVNSGVALCRSGVEPPTGTIHPRQIPPATPNPESHPLPNAGQCRSEVAPPTGIHRPTSNQRSVITPPSPAHSKTTASTDYHPPPTPPDATTSAKPEKPAPDAASSPQPARPPNKTPPRPLPNHSDYPDTPPSPPPESAKLRKKIRREFPPFFFKIGYNPPRNQSEFFDSENQKERNPCIGK